MVTSVSRITTEVDFERRGKQISYLRAPSSTNESAYGTVAIPITVISGGEGPTLFLTGGVHGDEYEGPLALMRVARTLSDSEVRGRVIVIPCLNLPAVQAGERLSPIDNLNLNRVFPGDRNGTLTPMIAHYVSAVLLPLTDIQVDLHSGGKTLDFIPMIQMNQTGNAARDDATKRAMAAFGAPIAMINKNPDDTGLLETTCDDLGIVNMSAELGGAGAVSPRGVEIAETGILNILRHFGIIEGKIVTPEEQGREATRMMRIADGGCYVMAPDDGLYEPLVRLGDTVRAGDLLGRVHYVAHADREPRPVHAERSGVLVCMRPLGRTLRGDNVGIIAQDVDG